MVTKRLLNCSIEESLIFRTCTYLVQYAIRKYQKHCDESLTRKLFVESLSDIKENLDNKLFDSETRKFSYATNVRFEDDARDFQFTTIELKDDADSTKEENENGENNIEDAGQVSEVAKKNETKSTKQESMTLRPRDKIKPPEKYGSAMLAIQEPQTYAEAMSSPDAGRWKEAIDEEIEAHVKNSTWYEEEIPSDRKAINCQWIFKIKQTPGEEDRFKARLVARGFSQRAGIDYDEIYAPVARAESCRVLFAKAAKENLEMMQFDIKTAFLYGELQEDIWIELSDGSWPKGRCVKLRKSL